MDHRHTIHTRTIKCADKSNKKNKHKNSHTHAHTHCERVEATKKGIYHSARTGRAKTKRIQGCKTARVSAQKKKKDTNTHTNEHSHTYTHTHTFTQTHTHVLSHAHTHKQRTRTQHKYKQNKSYMYARPPPHPPKNNRKEELHIDTTHTQLERQHTLKHAREHTHTTDNTHTTTHTRILGSFSGQVFQIKKDKFYMYLFSIFPAPKAPKKSPQPPARGKIF